MAWLNAVPDGDKLARVEYFEARGLEVVMPVCRVYHLVDYLSELGVTLGDQALTHSEIQSWMSNTGIELQAWETRFVKHLSMAYLTWSRKGSDTHCESPWEDRPGYMSVAYKNAMKLKASIRKMAEE